MQTTIDGTSIYIERLRSLTADMAVEDRFWVALSDDQLRDMEDVLCESDQADTFYDAIIREYGSWREQLTDDQWEGVLRRNRANGGANMNWLIEDSI